MEEMGPEDDRELLEVLFRAAVDSVDPYKSVLRHAGRVRSAYADGGFRRLLVVALGKAAYLMSKAAEEALGDILHSGVAITKYGHVPPGGGLDKVRLFEAGHPVPDENGLRAAKEAMDLARAADRGTLTLCLMSGGGSALLVSPAEGITLAEKQAITDMLLRAGADIGQLNTVRKHLSRVKGGRFAELAYPSKVISLILSDVLGDRLDVIASGPTAPDGTTYGEALAVVDRYGLSGKAPRAVIQCLRRGAEGGLAETPKAGSPALQGVENIIIGANRVALEAAKDEARRAGLDAGIITAALQGEAREAGRWLAREARSLPAGRRLLISGGETTVTVRGAGTGGRNTELALAFAIEAEGLGGVTLLSAGTDGNDGPTDAAGAFADGSTVRRARARGLEATEYLENNDSYSFFKAAGGLFVTGPTGTNVMDVQMVLRR
jgi:glycerate 2-kinase